ncbi:hypothetical protein ABPG74_016367 [Tetrahymena malaccensis]
MQNIQYLKTFYPKATVLKKIPIVQFQNEERVYIRNDEELRDKIIGMRRRQQQSSVDIVTDFDGTISSFYDDQRRNVSASFGIFRESKYVSADLCKKANSLFEYYHQFETSKQYTFEVKKKMMDEWLAESMKLILQNNIDSEWLQNIINDNVFALRFGFDTFLKYSYSKNLNFIVISGGIQDVIFYIINQIMNLSNYKNFNLIANKVFYDQNGKVIGSSDQLVHSHNKEILLNRADYPQLHSSCVLLGDMPHDSFMTQYASYTNQIKIGFAKNESDIANYKKRYDIVLHNQGSFVSIEYLMRKIMNNQEAIPDDLQSKTKIIGPQLIKIIEDLEAKEKNINISFST